MPRSTKPGADLREEREANDKLKSRLLDPLAHILVVEDDGEMSRLIVRLLRENGLRATAARDGREMWACLADSTYDLILLDVMLPGASGLELCRELRTRSRIPIIMVTARGDDTDRVVGLELGADDYITKPFNRRELIARIRAVLRRATTSQDNPAPMGRSKLTFTGWVLDLQRRELTAPDGTSVDLSTGEYDLLLVFLEHPQRILSRDQILDLARNRVAGGAYDRSIDVQVSRLRGKIEPDDSSPAMIKTIRGVGYMLVCAVETR